MNDKELLAWAVKAGAFPELSRTPDKDVGFLRRFAELVAAHEREQESRRHHKSLNLDLDGIQKEFLISAGAVGFVRNFHAPHYDSKHFSAFANDQRQIALYRAANACKEVKPPESCSDIERQLWSVAVAECAEAIRQIGINTQAESIGDKTPPAPQGTEGKPA